PPSGSTGINGVVGPLEAEGDSNSNSNSDATAMKKVLRLLRGGCSTKSTVQLCQAAVSSTSSFRLQQMPRRGIADAASRPGVCGKQAMDGLRRRVRHGCLTEPGSMPPVGTPLLPKPAYRPSVRIATSLTEQSHEKARRCRAFSDGNEIGRAHVELQSRENLVCRL